MRAGPLVRVDRLGSMFGVIETTSGGWVYAIFRSHEVIPRRKRPEVEKLFARERQRFPANRWTLKDGGEVALEVDALRLRGNLRLRLQIVNKQVFRRIRVPEEAQGDAGRQTDGLEGVWDLIEVVKPS